MKVWKKFWHGVKSVWHSVIKFVVMVAVLVLAFALLWILGSALYAAAAGFTPVVVGTGSQIATQYGVKAFFLQLATQELWTVVFGSLIVITAGYVLNPSAASDGVAEGLRYYNRALDVAGDAVDTTVDWVVDRGENAVATVAKSPLGLAALAVAAVVFLPKVMGGRESTTVVVPGTQGTNLQLGELP